MSEHISTLAAAERAFSCKAITDTETLNRELQSATARSPLLTTVSVDSASENHIVLCPADAVEVSILVRMINTFRRPVIIGVSDTPVPATVRPTDVIDIGYANRYRTGSDVTIVSTGPALHLAMDAARQLGESGIETGVVHLPAINPLNLNDVRSFTKGSSAVVIVGGHPLAAGLPQRLKPAFGSVPCETVEQPTVPTIMAAVTKLVGNGSQGSVAADTQRFAQRTTRLGTENAFDVLAEVNRLKAEGRDIISFAIGEPDFPTPSNIADAGIEAIRADRTHYSESQGIPPLREAVADYIQRTRGIEYGPENVVITPGAKPIMFNTIASVVDPDDEVIYPTPGFPIYESLIDFIGAKAVPLSLREEFAFAFDPDELRRLITPKTRLIIINSPQNPTGGLLDQGVLEAIADVATQHGIWVLSDEIYSQMVYDGKFSSIAALPGMQERTVILDGFSKTYSMTGWRIGFGVMPADLAKMQARIETNLNSCTATFTQWAAVEALNGPQDESLAMIAEFKRRRDIIVDGLNEIPGFRCLKPGGAFYVWPNVTEACRMKGVKTAKQFQERMLHEANVAVLPRTAFGRPTPDETDLYIRFSYATAAEHIVAGLQRIRGWMEK